MKDITRFSGEHRWLSNFSPAPVVLDGITYPTVEHAFQAAKTLDHEQRAAVRDRPTPGQAKRKGRRVTLRPDWEDMKETVMLDLLRQKFTNRELRAKLLATGTINIVEGNDWGDIYWGVDGLRGGQNRLGVLLMQVRREIQEKT